MVFASPFATFHLVYRKCYNQKYCKFGSLAPNRKQKWWNLNLAVASQVSLSRSIAVSASKYLNKQIYKKKNWQHAIAELATYMYSSQGQTGPGVLLHAIRPYVLLSASTPGKIRGAH